ncbi:hypothetical protein ABE458_29905, partial [Pseudomonas protegens]|uniref:hypothetical protein n=1 Tax=Pseudomonas protegens TaxID=380021 RepID=UPI00320AAE37
MLAPLQLWGYAKALSFLVVAGLGFFARKNKTPIAFAIGVSEFNLDDDLLSHGETPHYHRRCI